jgi:hypothetical protein
MGSDSYEPTAPLAIIVGTAFSGRHEGFIWELFGWLLLSFDLPRLCYGRVLGVASGSKWVATELPPQGR